MFARALGVQSNPWLNPFPTNPVGNIHTVQRALSEENLTAGGKDILSAISRSYSRSSFIKNGVWMNRVSELHAARGFAPEATQALSYAKFFGETALYLPKILFGSICALCTSWLVIEAPWLLLTCMLWNDKTISELLHEYAALLGQAFEFTATENFKYRQYKIDDLYSLRHAGSFEQLKRDNPAILSEFIEEADVRLRSLFRDDQLSEPDKKRVETLLDQLDTLRNSIPF